MRWLLCFLLAGCGGTSVDCEAESTAAETAAPRTECSSRRTPATKQTQTQSSRKSGGDRYTHSPQAIKMVEEVLTTARRTRPVLSLAALAVRPSRTSLALGWRVFRARTGAVRVSARGAIVRTPPSVDRGLGG